MANAVKPEKPKYTFIKNAKYYDGEVYEFNLPTGHTCPHAVECLVKVDRETGKQENLSNAYKCYASASERFPGVRESRWRNYEYTLNGGVLELPDDCQSVRIHTSGDFYSQAYFDMWVGVAEKNPDIEFWAYTKSLNFWVNRLDVIPPNLILTASKGGRFDSYIDKHNLKNVEVIHKYSEDMVELIDIMDRMARIPNTNFLLLINKSAKAFVDRHYNENIELVDSKTREVIPNPNFKILHDRVGYKFVPKKKPKKQKNPKKSKKKS